MDCKEIQPVHSDGHQPWDVFRRNWLDLLSVQGTLKSLLQHHSSKASILRHSAFFTVQLSHPYMTTGKTIALTRWTFVGKVMSLLFNMLSSLVITYLPRSKRLLNSWLHFCSKLYIPGLPELTPDLLMGKFILRGYRNLKFLRYSPYLT